MAAVDVTTSKNRFIDDVELSGIDLSSNPATIYNQQLRVSDSAYRVSKEISFISPSLNFINILYLPALPQSVENLELKFTMNAADGGATNTANYVQTFNWISQDGIKLYYKNSVIYTMSQAECESLFYLENSPAELARKQWTSADTSDITEAETALRTYTLHLQAFEKILNNVGCLSAFSSNAFHISVGLKSATEITYAATGSAADPGTGSINTMSLVVSGHNASEDLAMKIRQKLNSTGLRIDYTQSNYKSFVVSDSATSAVFTLDALEGQVSKMYIMNRNSGWVNSVLPENKILGDEFPNQVTMINPNTKVSLGLSSAPTYIWGRAMEYDYLAMSINGERQFPGKQRFVDIEGAQKYVQILGISFSDVDTPNGSAGNFYIKNDCRIQFDLSAAFSEENLFEIVTMISRSLILRSDGSVSNNL